MIKYVWTRIFNMFSHLNDKIRIIVKINFLRKRKKKTWSCHLFCFPFKTNKIRKKTLYDFLFGKDIFAKIEFKSESQVTY